jgi:divalent metal cation (Fe/Co/Zn/Cd) transporter
MRTHLRSPDGARDGARRERAAGLARGLRLELLSLGYNLLEAVVGLMAGAAAGSLALVGFGLDSVVESASASVLLWRLRAEATGARNAEDVERKAVRLVAVAFLALAAYVGVRGALDLLRGAQPEQSTVGIALAIVSVVVMPLLARLKRSAAADLDSRALQADARQTTLCTYLSVVLLAGLVANALFGLWWADPLAAIGIAAIAANEGLALWRTKDFCCA